MHVDDSLNKLKVRLITRDFSQIFEVDYMNTFASTVKFDTLRLFLIFVALKDLHCHQMNINNAFIEFLLNEIIYMNSSFDINLISEQALLIRRSFYELKQTIKD